MRVLVYHDNALTREGIAHVLRTRGVEVLEATCPEEAHTGMERAEVAIVGAPDVLGNGHRVLVLASEAHHEAVLGSLRAGAAGYLLADGVSPEDLYRALEVALSGEGVVISPEALEAVFHHSVPPAPEHLPIPMPMRRSRTCSVS